jgi:hypothetical protein
VARILYEENGLHCFKQLNISGVEFLVEKIPLLPFLLWISACQIHTNYCGQLLTSIIAIYKLIAVTLSLRDLIAFFGVIEGRTVRIMIPWRRWGRFRAIG